MHAGDEGSAYYPDLMAEQAAIDHEVHPFFDLRSWEEGFARGYQDGREDGEHLTTQSLRAALLSYLHVMAGDLHLGLRHDLETPLDVVHAVVRMIEDRQTRQQQQQQAVGPHPETGRCYSPRGEQKGH